MFRKCAVPVFLAMVAAAPLQAQDIVQKTSPHDVATTIDRLAAAVEKAGATVFARIDHAAGAASVDLELAPSQVLIFGNPKLGTPAMLDGPTAGLDLPLRALAYMDADGAVQLVYHLPATLASTHGLPADAEYIKAMTGALDKLMAH